MTYTRLAPTFGHSDIVGSIFSNIEDFANRAGSGILALDTAGYPPFNIVATGEETFSIEIAVAGLTADDVTLTQSDRILTVAFAGEAETGRSYIHQGIARRAFRRTFRIGPDISVTGARIADGLLTIDLERQVPEARRPREIEISRAADTSEKALNAA